VAKNREELKTTAVTEETLVLDRLHHIMLLTLGRHDIHSQKSTTFTQNYN